MKGEHWLGNDVTGSCCGIIWHTDLGDGEKQACLEATFFIPMSKTEMFQKWSRIPSKRLRLSSGIYGII
jgi:hypothetical protein